MKVKKIVTMALIAMSLVSTLAITASASAMKSPGGVESYDYNFLLSENSYGSSYTGFAVKDSSSSYLFTTVYEDYSYGSNSWNQGDDGVEFRAVDSSRGYASNSIDVYYQNQYSLEYYDYQGEVGEKYGMKLDFIKTPTSNFNIGIKGSWRP